MGISIFKNITSQQSKEFWQNQVNSPNELNTNEADNELIDYAKDIGTYNFDSTLFIVPLLRAKIQEAKESQHLSGEQKDKIVDMIYNSNLGDYYKKSLIDQLESPVNINAIINEAKNNNHYIKAYFSSQLTTPSRDKNQSMQLRSQISLSDVELQRIASDMITVIQNDF